MRIIAEIAQAHDGSLAFAHSYIDAIADVGADIVKFQMHVAAAESTLDDEFRVTGKRQDASRYDYWKRMEFSQSEWEELFDHARKRGIEFLASAFSEQAIKTLNVMGVPAFKVASGDVSNTVILDALVSVGRPVYLSTGMSTWAEIDDAYHRLRGAGVAVTVMQCTSEYPTPFRHVGLNVIDEIRLRYGGRVGLSDHSGSIHPGLVAISRGVDLLEIHVVMDKRFKGPDTTSSITIDELATLVAHKNAVSEMNEGSIDKDSQAIELSEIRSLFFRSIAPTKSLSKGTVLTKEMLMLKKPGTGIPPEKIPEIVGLRLKRDVRENKLLQWRDLDGS